MWRFAPRTEVIMWQFAPRTEVIMWQFALRTEVVMWRFAPRTEVISSFHPDLDRQTRHTSPGLDYENKAHLTQPGDGKYWVQAEMLMLIVSD